MPYYEYECPKCGTFEIRQKMADPPLTLHELCGEPVQRRISATSFSLKGGGWYADGYGSKAAKSEAACSPSGCEKPGCAAKAPASSS
jgi:putative FmdB family regulatory protein